MTERRAARALRDTKSLENWRWSLVEGAVLLVVTYSVLHRWSTPEDVVENVGLVFVAVVVTLVVVPLLEFSLRYAQAGRRIAEELIPVEELRRVIEADVRLHGPQLVSLQGILRMAGVQASEHHARALRTLEANGEVHKVQWRFGGIDTTTGERFSEAWFEAVAQQPR